MACLDDSPKKNIETENNSSNVKERCSVDDDLSSSFPDELACNLKVAALTSSESRLDTRDSCRSENCEIPHISYSGWQTEANDRKEKRPRRASNGVFQDMTPQGHSRLTHKSAGSWPLLSYLKVSEGSSQKGAKEKSLRESSLQPVEKRENEQKNITEKVSDPPVSEEERAHVFDAKNAYHGYGWKGKSISRLGIHTKNLAVSGLSQFYIKESKNDHTDTETMKAVFHSSDSGIDAKNCELEVKPTIPYAVKELDPSSSIHSSKAGENINKESYCKMMHNGVSLRELLGMFPRSVDKIESLHIFKQILAMVEQAHLQGIVLKNIRPSSFVLSSLNKVVFIEHSTNQPNLRYKANANHISSDCIESFTTNLSHTRKRTRHHGALGVTFQSTGYRDRQNALVNHHTQGMLSFGRLGPENSSKRSSENQSRHGRHEQNLSNAGDTASQDWKLLEENIETVATKSDERKKMFSDHSGYHSSGPGILLNRDVPSVDDLLTLEESWYSSPEELHGSSSSLASDVYSVGVLLFELFCPFASLEDHKKSMSNLKHRILPPCFLSEHPKEAGICLWLLHPDLGARPQVREIIQSELLIEANDALVDREMAVNIDEEDAETELLMEFLSRLQRSKQERAFKLTHDVSCLMSDIEEVERRRPTLMLGGAESTGQSRHAMPSNAPRGIVNEKMQTNNMEESVFLPDRNSCFHETSITKNENFTAMEDPTSRSDALATKGARLMKNFKHLEQVYFAARGKFEASNNRSRGSMQNSKNKISTDSLTSNNYKLKEKNSDGEDPIGCFFDGICKYARYSHFEVRASLRHGDLLNTANVICSVSFDRDQEFFATAGVSKKIKIFGCDAVLNENVDIHYPAVEISSSAKLSSVCWNNYIKSYLASTDYDGFVQLWDASTGQKLIQYNEHRKRSWSVDFSQVDPTKLATGSDDSTVKLWSIKQERSIDTVKTVANVCCVQFPPDSAHKIIFGSADYKIHCYDLRNTITPWCILSGHGKAVSYVKFLDSTTVISASTDSTLKMWDLTKVDSGEGQNNSCSLTYHGHTNEKNFVGLSVADGYIACGSETNSVFSYYKSLPMPMASHKFGFIDPVSGLDMEDDNGQFVSSVCWRGNSKLLVAANSTGNIKLLEMV